MKYISIIGIVIIIFIGYFLLNSSIMKTAEHISPGAGLEIEQQKNIKSIQNHKPGEGLFCLKLTLVREQFPRMAWQPFITELRDMSPISMEGSEFLEVDNDSASWTWFEQPIPANKTIIDIAKHVKESQKSFTGPMAPKLIANGPFYDCEGSSYALPKSNTNKQISTNQDRKEKSKKVTNAVKSPYQDCIEREFNNTRKSQLAALSAMVENVARESSEKSRETGQDWKPVSPRQMMEMQMNTEEFKKEQQKLIASQTQEANAAAKKTAADCYAKFNNDHYGAP